MGPLDEEVVAEAPVYGFDGAWEGERDRLALGATVLDPLTAAQLDELGVAAGWRCLEVGAGTGSVARLLADRVGPGGRVLAIDIDARFLAPDSGVRPYDVLQHNILDGPPEPGAFDLVHTRLVLQHLAARDEALSFMVAALAPGGWLVAEEFDFVSSMAACDPGLTSALAFAAVEEAIHETLAVTGFDPACGRQLTGLLRAAGLVDVEATGRLLVVPGGSPLAEWYARSIEALRPKLVTVDVAMIGRAIADLRDPAFDLVTPTLVSARGRRATQSAAGRD